MTNESSVTEATPDGWSVNDRGYIQGGFDTPIFLQAKQRFNSMRTQQRRVEKRKEREKIIDKALPFLIDAQKKLVTADTYPSFMPTFTPSDGFILATGHPPIIKEQHA